MEQIERIEDCRRRIADEEELAQTASSPWLREVHAQTAMLYMAQLDLLKTSRS